MITESQPSNQGANSLTNTLTGMMKSIANKPPVLDFGIINSDYSLTTNSFPKPIPKNQYNVCRSLLYNPKVPLTETFEDGKHIHSCGCHHCDWPAPSGAHVHQVKLPKKMYWVRPGQKVLVAWVANEAVVVDIIYSGEWLGKAEPPWE